MAGFLNEANKRGAIALVVGDSLESEIKRRLGAAGARGLATEDLVRIVELWDPAKQRIAVESMVYYAAHVEKNSTLHKRLTSFLRRIGEADAG